MIMILNMILCLINWKWNQASIWDLLFEDPGNPQSRIDIQGVCGHET